jgi:hypothetical protein
MPVFENGSPIPYAIIAGNNSMMNFQPVSHIYAYEYRAYQEMTVEIPLLPASLLFGQILHLSAAPRRSAASGRSTFIAS